MNIGVVTLIVVSAWSLASILASLLFGGMAKGRDGIHPAAAPVVAVAEVRDHDAVRRRDLAS